MPDSSRLSVALHILTMLALEERPACSSAAIAGSVNTNPVVVRRVLGLLRAAGLVESTSGAEGGARLARNPAAIGVAEVRRAVEPGALFALHHRPPNQGCPCGRNIQPVLRELYGRAEAAAERALAEATIADLAAGVRARLVGDSGGEEGSNSAGMEPTG